MSYYIDIIDTISNAIALKIEKASASGITLKWNGGDAKDELVVVSSELNFDMLSFLPSRVSLEFHLTIVPSILFLLLSFTCCTNSDSFKTIW